MQPPTSLSKILFFLGFLLLAAPGFAQEMSISRTVDDPELEWLPAPDFFPGCSFTVLHGDLQSPNLDFFFKVEPNTDVTWHTHKSAERMVLISGKMEVTYEGEPLTLLEPGTYAYGPSEKPHKARCLDDGPCVLFIALEEPFDAVPIEKE